MAPHGPFQAQRKYYEMFDHIEDHNKRVYYAMIKNLDDSVGEIKRTLESEGILDNTLIIFTSDNGGATYTRATNNSPYIGGKMSNFEGGTVVPMMMQWNNKIKPQKNYTHMVSLLDIVPTILDAVESPSLVNKYDGVSLLKYLNSENEKLPGSLRLVFYWLRKIMNPSQKHKFTFQKRKGVVSGGKRKAHRLTKTCLPGEVRTGAKNYIFWQNCHASVSKLLF